MSHRKRRNKPQPIPAAETNEIESVDEEKKTSSFSFLKKIFYWVKPLDFVILIVGGIVVSKVDFSEVTLVDIIYMTTFLMWFLFLLVRIYFLRIRRLTEGNNE